MNTTNSQAARDLTYLASNRNKAYCQWKDIRRRCRQNYKRERYRDCSMHDDFKNFHIYIKWAAVQRGFQQDGFQIDKDLLTKGNKIYGPDSCVFLPKEINLVLINNDKRRGKLPIGVRPRKIGFSSYCRVEKKQIFLGRYQTAEEAFNAYKVAKESELRRLAEKWRHMIEDRAYHALMTYQVEITD